MRKLDYEVARKSFTISAHGLIEHSRLGSVEFCELGIHHDALAAYDRYLASNFGR
jgi:hypothetical protein